MDPNADESQELLFHNKINSNIIRVGGTILDAASESIIDENQCLLNNKSTCNAFINEKYLSNIIYSPDGKYIPVHGNAGITYTNNIGDLPGYSNHVWYKPKGISNILSLGLVQKHHLVTYNSQDDNGFVIHFPQQQTFKMTKAGLFYHNMRQIIKNRQNAHILMKYSCYPVLPLEKNNKQYTARDVKRADRTRRFH